MELILFADDTNIVMSGCDLNKLVECVNSDLEKIVGWFRISKLSLKKTNYIVFTLHGRRMTYKDLNIKLIML